jgi:hypothetical protein
MNFGDRSIWNRDIDKLADESLLKILVVGTGTPPEQVFNTTLAAYRDWLYLQHNPYGNTQWVLPLGVYHRLRRGYDRLNPNTGSFSLGAGSRMHSVPGLTAITTRGGDAFPLPSTHTGVHTDLFNRFFIGSPSWLM